MGFRHYHLLHHRKFGLRGLDADVAPAWEIRLVGRSAWRKLIWLLLLPLGYTVIRPLGVKDRLPLDRWVAANILVIAIVWGLVLWFWGWTAATLSAALDLSVCGAASRRSAYFAGTYRL